MDELFRFVSVRPPQTTDANTVSIQGDTPFQSTVRSQIPDDATPSDKWTITRSWADTYARDTDPGIVSDIKSLTLIDKYNKLRQAIGSSSATRNLGYVESSIQHVFGLASSKLEADDGFQQDRNLTWDSIVIIFLVPTLHQGPFASLIEVAQIMDIVRRAAAKDAALNVAANIDQALSATVILPPDLLPAVPGRLRPVGIADLLVVKQHINRYELGEIVNIENILKGETRKKTNKHGLSNERTVMVDTTTTTETTTELDTSERFSLKREAQNTVKEDVNAKAGVNVSSKYGNTTFSANAGFDYSNAKTDSQNTSSDYAKDVTSRASTKVTQSIRVQQTTQVLETFEEDEHHTFDNAKGSRNVSGIYQWVNQIYTAQVFNYGKRLLFDIMVPEPAALLLDAANISTTTVAPVAPVPFVATPDLLQWDDSKKSDFVGTYLARYDVEGVDAPPVDTASVAKTFFLTQDDKTFDKGAEVTIPDGFVATKVHVECTYNYTDSSQAALAVLIGNLKYSWSGSTLTEPSPDKDGYTSLSVPCSKSIAVAIGASTGVSDYAVIVEIQCIPSDQTIMEWKMKTHSAILAAYNQRVRDYNDAVAAAKMSTPATGPLGSNNPDANRIVERTELKREAIQLLTRQDLLGFSDIQQDPSSTTALPTDPPQQLFPRPSYASELLDGEFARFFEQAFEWEQMQYIFYPYYWARKSAWYDKAMRTNNDPLFAEFLKAGQARVVIPVRPTMEPAVWYYLMTGQPWMGGDPPSVTSPDYLSIAEEIKENSGAPGAEVPYGPSWEITVPTTLVKLREGDLIEDVKWTLTGSWTWTPKPESQDEASGGGATTGSSQPGTVSTQPGSTSTKPGSTSTHSSSTSTQTTQPTHPSSTSTGTVKR
jgi:hypothetical protein